jgi:hypothetical protein
MRDTNTRIREDTTTTEEEMSSTTQITTTRREEDSILQTENSRKHESLVTNAERKDISRTNVTNEITT